MSDVFADTSGWANFFLRDEPHHNLANRIVSQSRRERARVITTNYVLAELNALLTNPIRMPRPRKSRYSMHSASSWIEIVHINPELDLKAWDLLMERPDKSWTLVDCSSFVLMKALNIRQALTSDHHCEQAGLLRLL